MLVKLFDANELLNNVKTENILLLDKVKNLELELSVAKEQSNRSASSKLDHMLSACRQGSEAPSSSQAQSSAQALFAS